jgi:putative hemolysin
MPIDEMAELFSISLPQRRSFNTVAGFALDVLGKLPNPGESFDFGGWHFEIVDLDGRRIDKLLASRLPYARQRPGLRMSP